MLVEFLLNCAAAGVFFSILTGGASYIAYKRGVFGDPNQPDGPSDEPATRKA